MAEWYCNVLNNEIIENELYIPKTLIFLHFLNIVQLSILK